MGGDSHALLGCYGQIESCLLCVLFAETVTPSLCVIGGDITPSLCVMGGDITPSLCVMGGDSHAFLYVCYGWRQSCLPCVLWAETVTPSSCYGQRQSRLSCVLWVETVTPSLCVVCGESHTFLECVCTETVTPSCRVLGGGGGKGTGAEVVFSANLGESAPAPVTAGTDCRAQAEEILGYHPQEGQGSGGGRFAEVSE